MHGRGTSKLTFAFAGGSPLRFPPSPRVRPAPRQGPHESGDPLHGEDSAASSEREKKEKEKERALASLGRRKDGASARPPDRPLMREDMFNL